MTSHAAHLLLPVIQPSAEENEVSMRMKDLVKLRNLGDDYMCLPLGIFALVV